MDDLRVQAKKEKGSPIKLHIEFYFNFVLRIIYIAPFSKSCSVVAHWTFKP